MFGFYRVKRKWYLSDLLRGPASILNGIILFLSCGRVGTDWDLRIIGHQVKRGCKEMKAAREKR